MERKLRINFFTDKERVKLCSTAVITFYLNENDTLRGLYPKFYMEILRRPNNKNVFLWFVEL